MATALLLHDALCDALIWLALRYALAVESYRRWVGKRARSLSGSLRRLFARWLATRRRAAFRPQRRIPWNRTPEHLEEKVIRLHVEQPQLGNGALMCLAERVLAFRASRETIRRILIRRRELVVDLEQARRRRPRRITVAARGQLWGTDLTLVWLLGFWPVWVLGAVDYHGSRLVAFERVRWPNASQVVSTIEHAVEAYGAPERLLTDRGPVFTSEAFKAFCQMHGIHHVLIRPSHPWTNGRIERTFRTFKETVFRHIWLFASVAQVDRYCGDFMAWYNRDRPHSSFGARTPDEVFFGRPKQPTPLSCTNYFDGRLRWWRFGPEG